MRAVTLLHRDGPDGVVLREAPEPERRPGQALIRVKAAALNRVDLYMRDDGRGITHRLPMVLGLDAAGEVVAVDADDPVLKPGDPVVVYPALPCGRCAECVRGRPVLCLRMRILGEHVDGVFRDLVAVPAANVFPKPATLTDAEAACLPTAYLTAWRMLTTKARLRPGDDVLIFGIGGGVATAALQIAKLFGARVIVTSRHAAKLDRARALGADAAIDSSAEDVVRRVMDLTDKRGVDVVVETVGQASWDWAMRSVARGGTIVCCGATSGSAPSADLQRLFIRQISVLGSTLGDPGEFAALLAAAASGRLTPVVDAAAPLEQAAALLDQLASGGQLGKLVLTLA